MIYLSLILVFLASVLITWLVRIYSLHKAILDIPNERSSHATPTPRGGGVAIVLVFLISVFCMALQNYIPKNLAYALVGGGVLIAVIGYLDDVYRIAARWRALVHLLAACWALYWLGGFPVLVIGWWHINWGWFGNVLAALGIMWFINLYNFMDGIDGLASMEGVFVSAVAGLFLLLAGMHSFALLTFLFTVSIAGFLVWNWPPAKIFMGDAGSGTLGFVFAVLLIGSANAAVLSPLVWFILLAIFIFDATFTLLRRIRHREPLYIAHRNHAYQYFIRRGANHLRVTTGVLLINLFVLLPLAYISFLKPALELGIFLVLLIGGWLSWYRITSRDKR